MNGIAEFEFLKELCIPSMISVLKDAFALDEDDNDASSKRNASLNLSDSQLDDFALDVLIEELRYDIENLAKHDPAASNNKSKGGYEWDLHKKEEYVWDSYKGLKAIMYYRIAHHLIDYDHNCLIPEKSSFDTEEDVNTIKDYMRFRARIISERAATETTIEINPSAQIGKGFVIDHGVGTKVAPIGANYSTVIGEACIIGENCTLLNSVLLGAVVINEAESGKEGVAVGKRHPTLGNNVTVCAGARILGNVNVGNNVTIGPCCVITKDIPDGYDVTIINQLQYTRPHGKGQQNKEERPIIHGLTFNMDGSLKLFGSGLHNCCLSIVSYDEGQVAEETSLIMHTTEVTDNWINFTIERDPNRKPLNGSYLSLRINTTSYEYILSNPPALEGYIMKLDNKGR